MCGKYENINYNYDHGSGSGQQLHSWSSPGERNGKFSQNGKFGQNGKLGHSCTNVTKGKLYGSRGSDQAIVHLGLNVSSSAHNCGCMVDGGNTMAAMSNIIILVRILQYE